MKFSLDRKDKYSTIKLTEEKLDASLAPSIKSEFLAIADQGVENLIVDLTDVKYIDSSGLSALLVGNRVYKEIGGAFILAGVSAHAMKLIKISQLDKVLIIMPTVEEAVDAVYLEELSKGLEDEEEDTEDN